jgi:hypothetical protein
VRLPEHAVLSRQIFLPLESPEEGLGSSRTLTADFTAYYPAPGSPPDPALLPKAWITKLKSIKLPDVPVAVLIDGSPDYGDLDGSGELVCSFTYGCTTDDDLVHPPDGILAVSRALKLSLTRSYRLTMALPTPPARCTVSWRLKTPPRRPLTL